MDRSRTWDSAHIRECVRMIHEDTRKRSKLLQEIAEDQRLKHGSAWPASRKLEGLGVAKDWPSPSDARPLFRLLSRKRTGGNPPIWDIRTSGASRQMLAESGMAASKKASRKSGRLPIDPTWSHSII
jgi:hypothetical protein